MSVTRKATDFLMLTESAKGRLNALLSNSMRDLEKEISSTMFALYNSLPDDADPYTDDAHKIPNPSFIQYQNLTANQKLRRDLETAQAYFLLYHTVVSAKEINTKNVMFNRATEMDGGSISLSDVEEINKLRNSFLTEARSICNNYSETGDIIVLII